MALVIGSSAGYGLAATIAGLARVGIRGIGVCFENGDAFSDTMKEQVADLLTERFGGRARRS
ncbi:enoyl-[acyl-carrier-protein] reductase FabV [Streptomyces tanashiensis]